MEYILLIHNNADASTTSEQWKEFFGAAKKSGRSLSSMRELAFGSIGCLFRN